MGTRCREEGVAPHRRLADSRCNRPRRLAAHRRSEGPPSGVVATHRDTWRGRDEEEGCLVRGLHPRRLPFVPQSAVCLPLRVSTLLNSSYMISISCLGGETCP